MDIQAIYSQLLIIIAVLTVLVNIITEVAKKAFDGLSGSKAINPFVTLLSVFLTAAVFLAYWQIKQMEITWYIFAAFIIAGFLVAYASMFGYDKLISLFKDALKNIGEVE